MNIAGQIIASRRGEGRQERMLDDSILVKQLSNIPAIKLSLICLPGQATPTLQALHRPLNRGRIALFWGLGWVFFVTD